MPPVAVTGLGCISAAGRNLGECMASIFRGERAPAPPVRFKSNHPVRYPVFEVGNFPDDPSILRTSALGLHAAGEALADAGLDAGALRPLRVGVCIGTT
ncbi:MAG TPA: beta-ketoacyl synthase N-terminal-like domain-containing protein, partial [Candidatus Deferrimicrobiaceae bacterium]